MSGSIQTIPARHGTATYVPRGHTIKIINSSGTQVIDTWAFALHAPPTGRQKKTEKSQARAQSNEGGEVSSQVSKNNDKQPQDEYGSITPASGKETQTIDEEKDSGSKQDTGAEETFANQDSDRKEAGEDRGAGERPKGDQGKPAESGKEGRQQINESKAGSTRWSAYIPSWSSSPKGSEHKDGDGASAPKKAPAKLKDQNTSQQKTGEAAQPSTWSSYIPTWSSKTDNKPSNSKGWSAYIPSGQGFSSYLPSQGQLSAFATLVSTIVFTRLA